MIFPAEPAEEAVGASFSIFLQANKLIFKKYDNKLWHNKFKMLEQHKNLYIPVRSEALVQADTVTILLPATAVKIGLENKRQSSITARTNPFSAGAARFFTKATTLSTA